MYIEPILVKLETTHNPTIKTKSASNYFIAVRDTLLRLYCFDNESI